MKRSAMVLWVAVATGLCLPFAALAAVFTVTNTNDSGPGSLRQALADASGEPANVVAFGIGSGVKTIQPLSTLVWTGFTVDGTTQPGYAGTPLIEIDCSLLPASTVCVRFGTTGVSVLRGVAVNRATFQGVQMLSGSRLLGCHIGTDPTGQFAHENFVGVLVAGGVVGGAVPGRATTSRETFTGSKRLVRRAC
jgi:hypothetical protein